MLPEANHRHRHRSAWTWRVSPSAIRHCSARARPRERKAPPAAPSGASWFSCGKRNRHMTTGRAMLAPGMAAVTSAVRHPRHGGRGRGPSSNRMACASAPGSCAAKKSPACTRVKPSGASSSLGKYDRNVLHTPAPAPYRRGPGFPAEKNCEPVAGCGRCPRRLSGTARPCGWARPSTVAAVRAFLDLQGQPSRCRACKPSTVPRLRRRRPWVWRGPHDGAAARRSLWADSV